MVKHALKIKLKRAYEAPAASDGKRILVERLWPRGIKKEAAELDGWLKDIAPSTELRKWYNHQPERWDDFQRKYQEELRSHAEILAELIELCRQGPVTFIFAAKDEIHNSAVVLKEFVENLQNK